MPGLNPGIHRKCEWPGESRAILFRMSLHKPLLRGLLQDAPSLAGHKMFPVEPSVLGFLTALTPAARARDMELEVRSALNREMDKVLNRGAQQSGVWSTFFRILLKPAALDARNIRFFEYALKKETIEQWISRDATTELVATLGDERPFGLYLRAYKSECAAELAGDSGVNAWRSIEIANVARVSERLPIYGLCNALDMNPLQKYRSVWLPPQFRFQWLEIVRELAKLAELIIVNASRPGNGLSEELKTIPQDFPEKTWLIIGDDEPTRNETADAVNRLSDHADHVSRADIKDGVVHDAWPLCPPWVQNIMIYASRNQSSKAD